MMLDIDSSRMLPAAAYLGRAGRVTRAAPKCSDGPRGVSSLSGGAGLSHGAEDGTGAGLEHAGGLCGSGVPAVLFGGGRLAVWCGPQLARGGGVGAGAGLREAGGLGGGVAPAVLLGGGRLFAPPR